MKMFNFFPLFEYSGLYNSYSQFPNNSKFLIEFLRLTEQMGGLFAVATQLDTVQSA
jgi:hypothetical protein